MENGTASDITATDATVGAEGNAVLDPLPPPAADDRPANDAKEAPAADAPATNESEAPPPG